MPRLAVAKSPGSKCRSPLLMAFSRSMLPSRRSSVVPSGRSTTGMGRQRTGNASPLARRSRQASHLSSACSGWQWKGQPVTMGMGGRSAARPRAAVDLAVPFSPRTSTPPRRGLMALRIRAFLSNSWHTRRANGYTESFGGILMYRAEPGNARLGPYITSGSTSWGGVVSGSDGWTHLGLFRGLFFMVVKTLGAAEGDSARDRIGAHPWAPVSGYLTLSHSKLD